ncbi:MAG: hypothetical protein ACK5QS_09455 [Pseudanabaenaceae cyanobacterium]|jgi:hypothetical protein
MNRQIRANHSIGEQLRHRFQRATEIFSCVVLGSVIAGTVAMGAEPLRAQDISLSPKFTPDPKTYAGRSGGSFKCDSSIAVSPKHEVELLRPFGFLRLQVESSSQITVRITGPDTDRCKVGSKFVLAGEWTSGKYRIWVGGPSGEPVDYKLIWSETR